MRKLVIIAATTSLAVQLPATANSQAATLAGLPAARASQASCDYSGLPGVVWWGTQRRMTLTEFASYAAPIYWFSPDEPTMNGLEGRALRVPETLPFQDQPDAPMAYYQYNQIGERSNIVPPVH